MTKRLKNKTTINNGWNSHIVHILCEKCDGKFIFKEKILSRLPKTVEISHEWVKTNFKYQEPEFYSRLFDDSEKGHF